MQRQVKWLGQVDAVEWPAPCGPNNPCQTGFACINGACVPSVRVVTPATAPQIDPTLIPQIQPLVQPPAKKTDNTALWVIGGLIGAGVLYYAIQ